MRRPSRATIIWFVLVLASMVSWRVGGGSDPYLARLGQAGLVILAFVKAGVIAAEFMGVRASTSIVRRAVFSWFVVVGAACTLLVAL